MTQTGLRTSDRPDLLDQVRGLILDRLGRSLASLDGLATAGPLVPGKMLRTRLALRLAGAGLGPGDGTLVACCAATEMVHTASLCHDDVIDSAVIRRATATLWRRTSCSAAVLIGDMLLCQALELVSTADGGRRLADFVAKVHQTCLAEAEQELYWRGKQADEATCLRLARGKTGALFSFVARLCGDRSELSAVLEEVGYRIGTAYQLADDLLDAAGSEEACQKTLGTDAARRKFTLAHLGEADFRTVRRHVGALLDSSVAALACWPAAKAAVAEFIASDLRPLLARQSPVPLDLDLAKNTKD